MTALRWIFAVFALLGAADKLFGGKLKLGEEFEKGIMDTSFVDALYAK